MFARLRKQWRDLRKSRPGRRFQDRYYGRKEHRRGFTKPLYLAVGILLLVVGIVMLPAPGPGFLIMLIAAAMLAEESLAVARTCDGIELKARALVGRMTRRWQRRRG